MAYAAGPHMYPDRVPAWYVHTLDSVVLAGPFSGEAGAKTAGARIAMKVAEAMRRDGGPAGPEDIRRRVEGLRVGFGLRLQPDGRFEAVSPESVVPILPIAGRGPAADVSSGHARPVPTGGEA